MWKSESGQEQKRIPSRGTSRSKDVNAAASGVWGGLSGSVPSEGPAGEVGWDVVKINHWSRELTQPGCKGVAYPSGTKGMGTRRTTVGWGLGRLV